MMRPSEERLAKFSTQELARAYVQARQLQIDPTVAPLLPWKPIDRGRLKPLKPVVMTEIDGTDVMPMLPQPGPPTMRRPTMPNGLNVPPAEQTTEFEAQMPEPAKVSLHDRVSKVRATIYGVATKFWSLRDTVGGELGLRTLPGASAAEVHLTGGSPALAIYAAALPRVVVTTARTVEQVNQLQANQRLNREEAHLYRPQRLVGEIITDLSDETIDNGVEILGQALLERNEVRAAGAKLGLNLNREESRALLAANFCGHGFKLYERLGLDGFEATKATQRLEMPDLGANGLRPPMQLFVAQKDSPGFGL